MMRKLLIFMLVLGMASLANAAILTVESSGSSAVNALKGATVSVDIVTDTAVNVNLSATLMQSTTSAAGNATAAALGTLDAGFNSINFAGNLQNANTVAPARFILIDRINGVISTGSPAVAAGSLYNFNLSIPGTAALGDTFTVDFATGTPTIGGGMPPYGLLQDGAAPTGTTALVITIPEPATIALLGLGGLVLLRKRK
jgi:hypothetical protein